MIAEIISNVHETKEYYSLILKRVDNQGMEHGEEGGGTVTIPTFQVSKRRQIN